MSIWWFVIFSVSLTCLGQVFQKLLALSISEASHERFSDHWRHIIKKPYLWLTLSCLGLGFLCWLYVLYHWPVSQAYPLLASNFLIMILAAKLLFKETIALTSWAGAVCIIFGLFLLGTSL
jgi:undecaprenyl phosphate-alpha-L-ara4N flippase subunit ArnE